MGARSVGCICNVQLVVSPLDGAAVWADRPSTGKPMYLTRHELWCPALALRDPDDYVILRPQTKGCER